MYSFYFLVNLELISSKLSEETLLKVHLSFVGVSILVLIIILRYRELSFIINTQVSKLASNEMFSIFS